MSKNCLDSGTHNNFIFILKLPYLDAQEEVEQIEFVPLGGVFRDEAERANIVAELPDILDNPLV